MTLQQNELHNTSGRPNNNNNNNKQSQTLLTAHLTDAGLLPGEHDDPMRNFILAQALPAVSYQVLVFHREIPHRPCEHRDEFLCRGNTRLLCRTAGLSSGEATNRTSANPPAKLSAT